MQGYITTYSVSKELHKQYQESLLAMKTTAWSFHTMAQTEKENSATTAARRFVTTATIPTPSSQHKDLCTATMHATDSEQDGEIPQSELITNTEVDTTDFDGQDYCMYRNFTSEPHVADSTRYLYSCPAETIATYCTISCQEYDVRIVMYVHMTSLCGMNTWLEFYSELQTSKDHGSY